MVASREEGRRRRRDEGGRTREERGGGKREEGEGRRGGSREEGRGGREEGGEERGGAGRTNKLQRIRHSAATSCHATSTTGSVLVDFDAATTAIQHDEIAVKDFDGRMLHPREG